MKTAAHPAPRPDFMMALAALALVSMGFILILSASSILAFDRYGNPLHFVEHQALFAIAGTLALLWLQGLSADLLRAKLPLLLGVATLMLLAVLVPGLGHKVGGARRWLGFSFLRFQPSELFKMVAVLFAAEKLAKVLEQGGTWKDAIPSLAPLALGLLLVLAEPDFGSTVLATLMLLGLLFVAGMPTLWLGWVGAGLVPVAAFLVLHSAYRLRRVQVFLNPWNEANGAGFQITHSMMAFGTGGIFGVGFGEGRQKLFYLPEPHTDFIFATAGEELGLVGCLLILAFFVLLLWRCWLVALKARSHFLKLGSLGLTLFLGLQVLANLFVVLGLAPTKGTTLPFLSSGGSALAIDLMAVGLLLNFSKQVDAEDPERGAR
ncbi:MAG TPA: putative lipid II flippase FtsW [bacterium]|jgi:cell division protein FtsW|nr:putative lipid II flippase FtsW [bacterium]